LEVRNTRALEPDQIDYARLAWEALGAPAALLDASEAHGPQTKTRYSEVRRVVILGANVYPAQGAVMTVLSRMSVLACLAHEFAHLERHQRHVIEGRPFSLPDVLLDEAETDLHASFYPALGPSDREHLVEDARDRIDEWFKVHSEGESG
jgi:hypothetical protein